MSTASKKILIFGALGAAGALIGCLLGEPLLRAAKPAGTTQAPATPSLVFSPEMTQRLQREGAKSGDVQLSLMWNNPNDLDLHCIDPSGEQIYFEHKKSASGGDLDVDMNARPPYSAVPVENIYWPPGRAPAGHYTVFVNHYGNHGGDDPTEYHVGIKAAGEVKEITGKISRGEPLRLVHEFDIKGGSILQLAPDPVNMLIVGGWTALLAVALSFALVGGQNRYLRRPLVSLQQAGIVLGGAAAAGMVAGLAGQMIYDWASRAESLAQAGRFAGWLILGGLLGKGMGFFIPNLHGTRAAIAGAVGGVVGALAFAAATAVLGDFAGRIGGALMLGFAIGLMVALVEAAFREAWLEISYGPNEIRTVSLGRQPVSIGGDQKLCTIYARNARPVACRYRLDQGKILCQDGATEQTVSVQPGDSKTIGNLTVTVRVPGKGAVTRAVLAPTPSHGLSLHLSNGRVIQLADNLNLFASDLPGLDPQSGSGPVAQVNRKPNDPTILGLKNLSRQTWNASVARGDKVQVKTGQSVRLASGNKIRFGSVEGEVRR